MYLATEKENRFKFLQQEYKQNLTEICTVTFKNREQKFGISCMVTDQVRCADFPAQTLLEFS